MLARRLGVVTLCAFVLLESEMRTSSQAPGSEGPLFRSACSATTPAAPAGSLPPLAGEVDDSNGNIRWVAKAHQPSPQLWHTSHSVTNRSSTENVYVHWLPDILETWIPMAASRGPATTGSEVPGEQPGQMRYGKTGSQPAPWYQRTSEARAAMAADTREMVTNVALTVSMNGRLHDVFLVTRSQAGRKPDGYAISYCLELDPRQGDLARLITIDWSAAASPQLASALSTMNADGLIHLPANGPARFELPIVPAATLREGPLVVNSATRERLGAALVPAYGPPR